MAKKEVEGLTIQSVLLENFKNLEKCHVEIGDHSIIIVGKNGSGKSSLIQAMLSPLDTKQVPTEPIKKGEERAKIELVLAGTIGGVPTKYTIDQFFTPGNKKGRIVVTNEAGETVPTPSTFIKSLIGHVSFDITKFLGESKDKKLKMLKALTGCEKEIDLINISITDAKNKIKFKKERAEELEAVLKNHGYSQEQIDLYSNPIPLKPLQDQLEVLAADQGVYDGIFIKTKEFEKEIMDRVNDSDKRNTEIERLTALIKVEMNAIEANKILIEKAHENAEKGKTWLSQVTRPDASSINTKINEAIAHNEHSTIIANLGDKQRDMLQEKEDMAKIKQIIEDQEKKRSTLIEKSQLNIPGLSFTEDDIYVDGMPLEEGQQNTARIFDISVDVAIALNPTLRNIFLHDGSLFDQQSLKSVVDKIENKGYRAIIECVSEGTLETKFTETALA